MRSDEISPIDRFVLLFLLSKNESEVRLPGAAQRLGISRGTLSSTLTKLSELGLVELVEMTTVRARVRLLAHSSFKRRIDPASFVKAEAIKPKRRTRKLSKAPVNNTRENFEPDLSTPDEAWSFFCYLLNRFHGFDGYDATNVSGKNARAFRESFSAIPSHRRARVFCLVVMDYQAFLSSCSVKKASRCPTFSLICGYSETVYQYVDSGFVGEDRRANTSSQYKKLVLNAGDTELDDDEDIF